MEKLEWFNDKIKLKDLKGYQHNPRTLNEKQYEELKASLEKFNLAEVPAIDQDNTIVAGHQRIRVLIDLHGPDYEIDIRRPNRKLTEKEFEEYLVRSNKNTGSWDFEILANQFETEDLIEWGFKEGELDINTIPTEDFSDKNKEIDTDNFGNDLEHTCPKCGFEFNE